MAVVAKRTIFLVQNLKRVGRDFTPPVPETFAMVDGRRVAAVNGQDEARRARSLAGRLRRPSRLHSRKPRASAGPADLGLGHERLSAKRSRSRAAAPATFAMVGWSMGIRMVGD
jgi:hypothetical protein